MHQLAQSIRVERESPFLCLSSVVIPDLKHLQYLSKFVQKLSQSTNILNALLNIQFSVFSSRLVLVSICAS